MSLATATRASSAAVHKPRVELVSISPQWAADMLAKNKNYRQLSEGRAKRLAEVMVNGGWQLNGETIKFKTDGSLIDGQHRLRAVVISGVTFLSFVAYGIEDDTNIDIGRQRSFANLLANEGETHTTQLAAAARWLWKYENGGFDLAGEAAIATFGELKSILEKYPNLQTSVKRVQSARSIVPAGPLAALHYLFSINDAELANAYVDALANGVNLKNDDAVYRLRERMLDDKRKKGKLHVLDKVAFCIKAWNFWRSGRSCQLLIYRSGGPMAEEFPEIQ